MRLNCNPLREQRDSPRTPRHTPSGPTDNGIGRKQDRTNGCRKPYFTISCARRPGENCNRTRKTGRDEEYDGFFAKFAGNKPYHGQQTDSSRRDTEPPRYPPHICQDTHIQNDEPFPRHVQHGRFGRGAGQRGQIHPFQNTGPVRRTPSGASPRRRQRLHTHIPAVRYPAGFEVRQIDYLLKGLCASCRAKRHE